MDKKKPKRGKKKSAELMCLSELAVMTKPSLLSPPVPGRTPVRTPVVSRTITALDQRVIRKTTTWHRLDAFERAYTGRKDLLVNLTTGRNQKVMTLPNLLRITSGVASVGGERLEGFAAERLFSADSSKCGACMSWYNTCLPYVIHPWSEARFLWDCFVVTLLLYTCLETPFTLAFYGSSALFRRRNWRTIGDWRTVWLVLSLIVDITLMTDVLMNLNTAVYKEQLGVLITDRRAIAREYFRSGFLVLDVCTSLPLDLIVLQSKNSTAIVFSTVLRLYRLFRILKLVRFIRTLKLLNDSAFASHLSRLKSLTPCALARRGFECISESLCACNDPNSGMQPADSFTVRLRQAMTKGRLPFSSSSSMDKDDEAKDKLEEDMVSPVSEDSFYTLRGTNAENSKQHTADLFETDNDTSAIFRAQLWGNLCLHFVLLMFVAHLCACLWYGVARTTVDVDSADKSWITRADIIDAPVWTKYSTSFYWAVVTLFTTGYGDIVACNRREQWTSVAVVITGTGLFAYIISVISRLLIAGDTLQSLMTDRLEDARTFCRLRRLDAELTRAVLAHVEYGCLNAPQTLLESESAEGEGATDVFEQLPYHVRRRVSRSLRVERQLIREMFESEIRKRRRKDWSEVVIDLECECLLAMRLRFVSSTAGEVLFERNEYSKALYVHKTGDATKDFSDGNTASGQQPRRSQLAAGGKDSVPTTCIQPSVSTYAFGPAFGNMQRLDTLDEMQSGIGLTPAGSQSPPRADSTCFQLAHGQRLLADRTAAVGGAAARGFDAAMAQSLSEAVQSGEIIGSLKHRMNFALKSAAMCEWMVLEQRDVVSVLRQCYPMDWRRKWKLLEDENSKDIAAVCNILATTSKRPRSVPLYEEKESCPEIDRLDTADIPLVEAKHESGENWAEDNSEEESDSDYTFGSGRIISIDRVNLAAELQMEEVKHIGEQSADRVSVS